MNISRFCESMRQVLSDYLITQYVITPDADKVNSLEKITALYNETGVVFVWSGKSDNTIFDNPQLNYSFRAWHDYVHIIHQIPFTPEGEAMVCKIQQMQIRLYARNETEIKFFDTILDAEVNGQIAYEKIHGHFPLNQREFTTDYITMKQQCQED